MPRIQTKYGGVCPLGKFSIDIPGGAGSYTNDPVEKCPVCNFADMETEDITLEERCQCPVDMTWQEYDKLREQYWAVEGKKIKKGFQEFVKENYPTPEPQTTLSDSAQSQQQEQSNQN